MVSIACWCDSLSVAAEGGDEWSQLSLDDQFRYYEAAKEELA